MRGKRARDIRKFCLNYMKENGLDMKKFKNFYRRTKRIYMVGE